MGKRANGEGSVYQRKDGRWVASIMLDDGRRKSVYCKTQKEAIKASRHTQTQKEQGTLPESTDQTIEFFLTDWLEHTAHPQLRERTYIRYRGLIRQHIIPNIGKVKLQKLTPQHLQRLYNQKLQEGYAPQSVKHIHRLMHRALRDALRWNLVGRNVCDAVDAPRVAKHEMQTLTPEQAQQFLEAARDDPFEALYILAITTGMRQGELLGLKWQDIQLEQAKLQVRRSLARVGKLGFVMSEPKTKAGRRAIALATVAIEALKRHRLQQNERRLAAGPAWEDHDLVFCNLVGKPLEAGNLMRRSFRPLLEKAGAPKIRFHDLRHSAATLLLSMNVHPKIVQELLGHSSITITLDTYSHVLPSLQSEAVARFDTLLAAVNHPVAVTVAVKEKSAAKSR